MAVVEGAARVVSSLIPRSLGNFSYQATWVAMRLDGWVTGGGRMGSCGG